MNGSYETRVEVSQAWKFVAFYSGDKRESTLQAVCYVSNLFIITKDVKSLLTATAYLVNSIAHLSNYDFCLLSLLTILFINADVFNFAAAILPCCGWPILVSNRSDLPVWLLSSNCYIFTKLPQFIYAVLDATEMKFREMN